jgi:hypothetical protein
MTDRYDERDLIAIQNTGRFDANEGIFFARQLEHVKSRTYDVKRPALNAMRLLPISTEAGEGATTITYRQYDGVGMAKIIANYANDLPRADVKGKEFTSPIRSIGDAYGYSTQEIRSALMAGTNLESRKATMAARAQEELINRLAWAGDTVSGLPGLLSNANIPALTLTADGTGSSKAFTTKTPAQIVRDVQALINLVRTLSKDIHKANAVWMPLEQLSYIAGLKNDTGTDTTVLEFLQRNNPGVSFEAVLELDGAGASGADRMYAGEITADNLTLEIPMMLKTYTPQQQGLEFVVPMESRVGGVVVYYPLALAYTDGI